MNDLITKTEFWVAMVVAAILKFKASPPMSPLGAASTIVAGVGSAVIFTPLVADWFSFNSEGSRYAIAGLVMLTAEHFSRILLSITTTDLFGVISGKKK